jgi:hypothetical protein
MTFVEMAISVILVAVMLVVALKMVGAARVDHRILYDRRSGDQLAQGLMTEILRQDYADADSGPDSFGVDAGEESTESRHLFDDVDDYDGWSASPPQQKDGTEMAGRSGWRRSVAVDWVDSADFAEVVGSNHGVKRITVVVSRDGVPVARLQAIRTSGLPGVEACCFEDDSCLIVDPDTCVALGGFPWGDGTSCYNSTCCTRAVTFEGLSEAKPAGDVDSVMLDTPTGTNKNELLVAVVVVNDAVSMVSAPGAWIEITQQAHPDHALTMGVWWKLANAFEPGPHTFTWMKPAQCYAWIMRFSGNDTSGTFQAMSYDMGTSVNPPSPAVVTWDDFSMILRLGGFDNEKIIAGDPGLYGHTAITMASSFGGGCSGGAGYLMQAAAGDSGVSAFTLVGDEEYVTVTLAVLSEECE